MQLNEETCVYMKKASSQIEGITCALSIYIENTINNIEKYHYKVYNDLFNEVRCGYIDAVIQIGDVFKDTSISIENIAKRICASSISQNNIKEKLQDFEECLNRLEIHSKNIRECNSDTENPYVPNSCDEIYKSFSGYKTLIDEYALERPRNGDVVSSIIFSFYEQVINIYDKLFREYDKMLDGLAVELQERWEKIETEKKRNSLETVKKRTIFKNIGQEVVDAGISILGGVRKKEVFLVVDKGVGIIKTISEEVGDVLPQKSLARKALKRIESFGKTMDLVGAMGMQDSFGLDDNTLSAIKLLGATVGVSALGFHQLNIDGRLDTIINAAEATSEVINTAGALVSGKPLKALVKLPATADKVMNLIESMAEYYDNNDVQEFPQNVERRMRDLANQTKQYEEKVNEYKANLIRGIPARKPKAPPWIKIHEGVSFASDTIEKIMERIEGG